MIKRSLFLLPALLIGTVAAEELPFTVELTTRLSTDVNHKGDPVTGRVIDPDTFRGELVQGHVTQAKAGGKLHGEAILNFTFDTLQHNGAAVPISCSITSITNSKGETDVDEEGRAIRKNNNLLKAAAGAGVGALIGGVTNGGEGAAIGAGVGAAASLIMIEVAATGPRLVLAPGSRIGLSAKSHGGPDLATLPPVSAQAVAAVGPQPSMAAPGASVARTSAPAPAATNGQPQFSAINMDFIPGEKVVFYDDFSDMAQGEPPPHWKLTGTPMELRTDGGIRELYAKDTANLTSPSFAAPKNFTFEVKWTGSGETIWNFNDKDDNAVLTATVRREADGATASLNVATPDGGPLGNGEIKTQANRPVEFALWVQQGRVRAYLDGQRLVDTNQVNLGALDHLSADIARERPNGICSVRLAESAPDFATVISSNGRYVTHGIYFDNDGIRLRPESAPVIKLVAQGLQKNPNLKLEIDMHSDSIGDPKQSEDLSRRRAEALKSVLVTQFNIDAGRLMAAGFGGSKPVASNDTADGRAQNRRVEFVRQ